MRSFAPYRYARAKFASKRDITKGDLERTK